MTARVPDRSLFEVLLGLLAERMAGGDPPSDALPRLRFPALPAPPLGPAIPRDLEARHWRTYLRAQRPRAGEELLDFGCGTASRRPLVEKTGYRWHGLDIPTSTESLARADDSDVTLYEGLEIPFDDGRFAAVLSTQTFEHVADPQLTFAELARVLEPGGLLIGSTSHLEAFHSDSTFTYTPALFASLLERNGVELVEIGPGIDGLTLLTRRLVRQFGDIGASDSMAPFFLGDSPLNRLIEQAGERQGAGPEEVNALKLELVGQFHFIAAKR
jgi:SAM-dependent methyltransferase